MAVGSLGCGEEAAEPTPSSGVTPPAHGARHPRLSDWGLFRDAPRQLPRDGVVPFEPIAPLFSDYTHKRRWLYLPPGEELGYSDEGAWELPVGSILIKTFSYPQDLRRPVSPEVDSAEERLMETRLLHRSSAEQWTAHTYVWDEAGQQTENKLAGATLPASFIDSSGEERQVDYGVPNLNACQTCHGALDVLTPLGLTARQLVSPIDYGAGPEDQLEHLEALGWLDRAPSAARERLVDPFAPGDLHQRARSYFDANCASCHREAGFAAGSGVWLDVASMHPESGDPTRWGVCKQPTAASGATCGLTYDIVPGHPEASILICRTASSEREVRMPPLATTVAHAEGVAMLSDWIRALPPASCTPD
ncbi:MAG: hypothetical protein KIT72_00780 [Polyangiaceae bacterium]|nr:hypothetical protein [Polyangiaceae bacterium]MCW5788930.1 hypothetical protein [Polyangiaceae bacterium]